MSRWPRRLVHKWLAVTVSAFFLAWLISGLAMILPAAWPAPRGSTPATNDPRRVDFRAVQISVPRAIATAAAELGPEIPATHVEVVEILGRPVYKVTFPGDRARLVDALSGAAVTITPSMAEAIARVAAPAGAAIIAREKLDIRDFHYWGPLRALKIVFDDTQATVVYVSIPTGQLQAMNRLGRLRRWIGSLHQLEPLRFVTASEAVRVGLLLLSSLGGIAAVGTGLYLALPTRSRRGDH